MTTTPRPLVPWRVLDAITHELVGAPFVRGARGPAAFDCWGLVLEVRRRLALPLPPDFASGADVSRAEVLALFHAERPSAWRAGELTLGGIVLAPDAGHAGVHLAGRVLHAQAKSGAVAVSLGQWAATFGPLECWECTVPAGAER